MPSKCPPILLSLSLIALLTSCAGLSATRDIPRGVAETTPATLHDARKDFSQANLWLRQLRSLDEKEREGAKNALIAFSSESASSRQYAIGELLKIIDVRGERADLMVSPERFLEWKEAADILGTLKATEAIDLLVECLDCNNGRTGLGPGRFPATVAIIKFGDEAVPKLAKALEQKSFGIQLRAAQALYVIGSDAAKESLEGALRETKNKRMAAEIKDLLRNWNSSGGQRT